VLYIITKTDVLRYSLVDVNKNHIAQQNPLATTMHN